MTTSEAIIEQGATIGAVNVEVEAHNTNDFLVSASAVKKPSGIASSIAISLSDISSTSNAQVDGAITASGNVAISARTTNINNDTVANAAVKKTLLDQAKQAIADKAKAKLAASNILPAKINQKLTAASKPDTLTLSAGLVFASSVNQANAKIGSGAVVAAGNDLSLTGEATDNFKSIAIGSSKAASKVVIGGAVAISDYTNEAMATIDGGATVDATKDLSVSASAIIPNQIEVDDDLQLLLDFDFNFPTPGDPSDPAAFYEDFDSDMTRMEQSLAVLGQLTPYLSANLGIPDKVATSFVGASAASEDGAGKFSLSGSVNFLTVTNNAVASIGQGAMINTTTAADDPVQSVAVDATASIEAIHISGIPSVLNLISPGAKGSGGSVGGSSTTTTPRPSSTTKPSSKPGAESPSPPTRRISA